MLHNEARKLLVQAFKKCHNARKIASIFSVSRSTVYRLEKQQERTGSVALRTHQRGRKHLLDRTDLNHIQSQIEALRTQLEADANNGKLTESGLVEAAPLAYMRGKVYTHRRNHHE